MHDSLSARTVVDTTAPFALDSKIVVIGAGPAGLHMASRLKALGYNNITILERTSRVGGKSYTWWRNATGDSDCEQQTDNVTGIVDTASCISHEMGTCFLHNGYKSVRELVEEYGLHSQVPPEGRAMFSHYAEDKFHSQEMTDFISSAILDGVEKGEIKSSWWVPKFAKSLVVMDALTKSVKKYNDLHLELFGPVEFSMPERLSPDRLKKMDMTFDDFLRLNGLAALSSFLSFAQAAQGYGYTNSIPAFYGLWWVSPELLNGFMQQAMHEKIQDSIVLAKASKNFLAKKAMGMFVHRMTKLFVHGNANAVSHMTTMLPEGYGKIWRAMYKQDDLDVRFRVEIKNIDRQLTDSNLPVKVTYSQNGEERTQTEEYDFLLYTAPFKHASKFVNDLTQQEGDMFSQLKSFVLSTTMYRSNPVPDYSEPSLDRGIMYNPDKMAGKQSDGGWFADRNDPLIFGDVRNSGSQQRVAYQFFEDYCKFDSALCETDRTPNEELSPRFAEAPEVLQKFKNETEDQGVTDVKIIEQFPWPYFHHFPQDSVNAGAPWDLLEMQGTQKTWWLGASACFESVHDVTNYNKMILKKYLGPEIDAAKGITLLKDTEEVDKERDLFGDSVDGVTDAY